MPTLREVVVLLDTLYRPEWADDWDAVGTVVGDPDAEVTKILLAVDPVQAVVDEAVAIGAHLVITHHPLLLRGVTTVAANTPKGRVIHDLISHGIGLHTCHTNADSPPLGVSESMGLALGLTDLRPLQVDGNAVDKWIVFVPEGDAERVAAAMHDAGAGIVGDYDRAMFSSRGTGQFRPLAGANPAIGSVGAIETVDEVSLEMVADPALREAVRAALLAAHPYEEVAYDVIATEPRPSGRGSGRIGVLPEPTTLRSFAAMVADRLPGHRSATRVAGDPDAPVRTVALCGGSGDFLLGAAQAGGADVYVTSDLRHHPVSEHRERAGACAVIDVPHWAAEWTWLPVAGRTLRERLGDTVEIAVSTIVTDPWTFAVPAEEPTLKADPSAQLTLLDLQAKDAVLAQLDHRRKTLPEHVRIEALEAQIRELDGRRVAAETEVGDLERAQAKFDAEIELVRQRRVRDEDRMSSGAITNPKDLSSLQHEVGALERRISTLEDEELEIMEQLENAQNRLASVSADVHQIAAELEHETAARDAATQVIDAEAVSLREARDELAIAVPSDLRDLYDKVRGQHGGLGAAALRARRCEGCHLEINGADLRELTDKPDDEVLRCPECSRILIRTAESGL